MKEVTEVMGKTEGRILKILWKSKISLFPREIKQLLKDLYNYDKGRFNVWQSLQCLNKRGLVGSNDSKYSITGLGSIAYIRRWREFE